MPLCPNNTLKAQQTEKSTNPLKFLREIRSQGKPLPTELERQIGRYREQLTKAETYVGTSAGVGKLNCI